LEHMVAEAGAAAVMARAASAAPRSIDFISSSHAAALGGLYFYGVTIRPISGLR
jgi:hypothetical protein